MTGRAARFKERFYAFRGGSAFFIALTIFLIGWFVFRHFLHFDPDNSWLNLLLSIEASTTTSLLLDLQVKTTARDRATLQRILDTELALDNHLQGKP